MMAFIDILSDLFSHFLFGQQNHEYTKGAGRMLLGILVSSVLPRLIFPVIPYFTGFLVRLTNQKVCNNRTFPCSSVDQANWSRSSS
jgi:hypothetical protein